MKILHSLAIVILFVLGACVNVPTPTAPSTILPSHAPTFTAVPAAASPTRAPNTATPLPPTATRVVPTATATRIPPTPSPTPIGELEAETNAAWERFVAGLEADDPARAQTRVDAFWQAVTALERVPLVLNDTVIFLYKGDASAVTWRGDFSYWQFGTGLEGKQVGSTDLWYATANFPRDSRTDYKIVLDGTRWILDPANPHTQPGGLSDNSVLTMPAFEVTDLTDRQPNVPVGNLTDWITLESKALGMPVNYRLYFPPNYAEVASVPVLYVTDGSDFSDERMGALQIVLDNLIAAEKITPMLVVFIDAREPGNPDNNMRETQFLAQPEKFSEFIVSELVKYIDAAHRTQTTPDARGLVGTSYGGVFTTYAGLRYPEVFGKLAIFSPAYWVLENPDGSGNADYAAGARRMNEFVQNQLATKVATTPESTSVATTPETTRVGTTASKIFMSAGIPNWDVGDLEFMAAPLRARGDTVQVFQVQEGHSWGAWSGLTDEMLEYLFAN